MLLSPGSTVHHFPALRWFLEWWLNIVRPYSVKGIPSALSTGKITQFICTMLDRQVKSEIT